MKKNKAWKVIDSPKKWCKKYYSKTKYGEGSAGSILDDAVKFCAVGAYCVAYGVSISKAEQILEPLGINHRWNDNHTYKEVFAKLKALNI